MTIKERITEDMKNAMRAHDTARLSALRLLLAAIKQREVDDRVEATDELVTGVIGKLIKQRRDSVKQYTDAGRADLAQKSRTKLTRCPCICPLRCPTRTSRRWSLTRSQKPARAVWRPWAKSWASSRLSAQARPIWVAYPRW